MVKCPECEAWADLTRDGAWAHCASCKQHMTRILFKQSVEEFLVTRHVSGNTIFEPGKEGSHYRGSGSGSGDKEEEKKGDTTNDESVKKD